MAELDLGGIAAELLAQGHRNRIHHVSAAGLHQICKFIRFPSEGGGECLQRREKHVVLISALTGQGLPELMTLLDEEVPHLETRIHVVLPYAEGALVSRIHSEGEVLLEEHLGEGTRLEARVGPQLAAELASYAVA